MLAALSISARHPKQARLVVRAAALAMALLLLALCDPRGIRQLQKLRRDLDRQRAANDSLRAQNAELSRAVRELTAPGANAALERAVREQLGFVRDDEVVFKFE
jgi:cell division protein FtsB